jgi:hypothetical protein
MGSFLAASLLIGAFDVFVLGLAITFGPGGFGGDRDWSAEETAAANLGQAAGLIGILLAGVAVVLFLAMRRRPNGRAVLGAVLGVQLLASFVLVLTTG